MSATDAPEIKVFFSREKEVRHYAIPVFKPYDFTTILEFLERHAAYGIEKIKNNTYTRYVPYKNTYGVITVTMKSADALAVTVQGCFYDGRILESIKNLFDTRHNPLSLPTNTGIRAVGCFCPFEVSISIILGQLISIKHATKKLEQLIIIFGKKIEKNPKTNIYAFPEPKDIVDKNLEKLGITKLKASAIRGLSRCIETQVIIFSDNSDIKTIEKKLLSIKGIGHWTAQLILMRCFQFKDAYPKNDLFIQRAIKKNLLTSLDG